MLRFVKARALYPALRHQQLCRQQQFLQIQKLGRRMQTATHIRVHQCGVLQARGAPQVLHLGTTQQ